MNNKSKNILFTVITAVLAALAVLSLLFLIFGWQLNLKTYAKADLDGINITLKGNSRQVRRLILSGDSIKKQSVPFSADPSIANASDIPIALLQDVNFDGNADLLILSAVDSDGDLHRTVLLYDPSQGNFVSEDKPTVLVNPVFESDRILTSGKFRKEYASASADTPPVYEAREERAVYTLIDGALTRTEERAITYYSESDIYCYSIYAYDHSLGELSYVDEQWFESNELGNYSLD